MMMVLYGQTVRWQDRSLAVSGYSTEDEAYRVAWDLAFVSGYTVPRWWEFWRWGDSRPDMARLAELRARRASEPRG